MAILSKFWIKQIKETLMIGAIGIPLTFLVCTSCLENWDVFRRVAIMNCIFWMALWKGNEFFASLTDRWVTWLEAPVKKLIVSIVVLMAYTSIAVWLIVSFSKTVLNLNLGGSLWYTVLFAMGVTIFMTLILHAREFLQHWRKLELDMERMRNENLSSKYETLKNQVNPHFLFNSFNVLTNLVYEDQDQAAKFIKQLSEVYRYVLDQKDKEVVEFNTELKFAQSYIFLQKIRFGENLIVNIDVPTKSQKLIAPLSLQMLIENAIKHNIVSEDEPLTIDIKLEDDYITVSNNLQRKNILKEDSSNLGLSNIQARYEFLTNKPVEVLDNGSDFIVRLPLLNLGKDLSKESETTPNVEIKPADI
ncbi:histidine kinase [Fulvivirgaceae bacterium BMA10]|uniref:Histidine kinase n=1 Tax=Splendidivirga corallicola TaxID=3051826 RepID=A0ABT8KX07_9BACT|nr:histidine kinase [Fulvivirgaceae bacterium BMA10]